jgi:LacI family transcriptional regulator
LIIVPCEGAESLISELVASGFPLVLIDRSFDDINVSSVTLNNIKATTLAVNELVASGYKKISFVSYKTGLTNILDREMGYRKAMRFKGLAEHICTTEINYSLINEELAALLPRLINEGTEALILSTNRLAIEALIVLQSMGITVPDDVAFVGFDGSETFAFNLYPKGITYIKQPIEQFGYEAFNLLVANIVADGKTDVVNIELNPELVVKESSKKS